MIILKNIDLSKVTLEDQCKKIIEEGNEVVEAIVEYTIADTTEDRIKAKKHVIEEYWDIVQAYLGLLQQYDITAEEVMAEYPKHLEKIKNRPRD